VTTEPWSHAREGRPNNALQLTRARSVQQVRAERHFVPHRAVIIYGPSQLNAVFDALPGVISGS
jgi:hypothetical protein